MEETDDLAEHLSCPICFELPSSEIYQCRNGHTICAPCSDTLSECPQCREPFGDDKIRNRALEAILQGRKLEGCNKEFGSIVRKDSSIRSPTLGLLEEESIPICQITGHHCSFVTSTNKFSETTEHFNTVHNSANIIGLTANIILENFKESKCNKTSIWTPAFLESSPTAGYQTTTKCMTVAKINGTDQTFSLISLLFQVSPEEAINYSFHYVFNSTNERIKPLRYTTSCLSIHEAEAAISEPTYRIPVGILKQNFLQDGNLELFLFIRHKSDLGLSDISREEAGQVLWMPSREISNEEDSNFIKEGIQCNHCKTKMKNGPRYHCLQCADYDLCDFCRTQEIHSHHLFAEIRNHSQHIALTKLKFDSISKGWKALVADDVRVEESVFCTQCQAESMETPARLACMVCVQSYGICDQCCDSTGIRKYCRNHTFLFVK